MCKTPMLPGSDFASQTGVGRKPLLWRGLPVTVHCTRSPRLGRNRNKHVSVLSLQPLTLQNKPHICQPPAPLSLTTLLSKECLMQPSRLKKEGSFRYQSRECAGGDYMKLQSALPCHTTLRLFISNQCKFGHL